MKKLFFTLSFFSLAYFPANLCAQECAVPSTCTPSGLLLDNGFEDPNVTQCVEQGVPYNYAIQFKMFTIFNFAGVQQVDSIQFEGIDNLPCGLCWSVNKANKRYVADEDGCINISGTSSDAAGQYKLQLTLKAWINGATTGLTVPYNTVDSTGIKILLRVKAAGGTCVNADTSASANNLTAATTCPPVGINELAQNISSLNIVPNPMNTNGVLSFFSEKNGDYTIRISDVTGKIISSKEVEVHIGANSFDIEQNNLSRGIYFLTLSNGKDVVTKRFSVTE